MQVFYNLKELKLFISELKKAGKAIGFVPTMGALHAGHVSLIEISKQQTDVTVCSIFVNPTQFNNTDDLKKYPRTPEKDIELLNKAQCDVLYMPDVNDVYPTTNVNTYKFGYLDAVLEGAHRPGHFNGVGQVVSILLQGIEPHYAYFGSKDFQQVMVVKELVKQLQLPVKVIACPIIREEDGLAMSSRNMRLLPDERKAASLIPKIMKQAVDLIKEKGVTYAKLFVEEQVQMQPMMRLDYYEVCDAETLKPITDIYNAKAVSLIAVYVGNIRLIDNFLI